MDKKVKCYIVEDEPDARSVLKKYIERVPFLELVGESGDPISALFQVSKIRPDLLFLDVEMPDMNGFEFIRSLKNHKPQIILVTAYPDYALEGYDYQVADYLLKPVPFERFLKGVYKAVDPPAVIGKAGTEQPKSKKGASLLIKENKKLFRIGLEEIELVEATGDYVKIYSDRGVFVSHGTLTKMEKQLPEELFIRINRSFIIRKNAIVQIDGNEVTMLDGKKVPIGITYRDNVFGELYPKETKSKAKG